MGFWTKVFAKAMEMIKADPVLKADAAYLLARRKVEEEFMGLSLDVDPNEFPNNKNQRMFVGSYGKYKVYHENSLKNYMTEVE